jgi:hypothetical protein
MLGRFLQLMEPIRLKIGFFFRPKLPICFLKAEEGKVI